MTLKYPLFFPYGENGFTLKIPYKCHGKNNNKRKFVTMLEYNAYYLFQCPNVSMLQLMLGCLSLQYWVDVYTCLEQNRCPNDVLWFSFSFVHYRTYLCFMVFIQLCTQWNLFMFLWFLMSSTYIHSVLYAVQLIYVFMVFIQFCMQ
jgi:hypothetical protein